MGKLFDNIHKKNIMAWLWLAVAYLWNAWYQVFRGERMLDSDMSSEMVLADLLNQEHSLIGITDAWNYSTELRFLQMQWFYRLGLFLFPHKWHAARTTAMMLALAVLACAVIFVFHAAGLKKEGVWAAALCLLPGGNWYFWQTLYGGYYLPYIYISLFTMGLAILFVKNRKTRKGKIDFILLLLLGIGSGLNGVKQLMVFYAPFVLATAFVFLCDVRENYREKQLHRAFFARESFGYLVAALIGTVGSVFGYVINSKVLSKIYHFRDYNTTKILPNSFLFLMKQYIWSFGYVDGKVLLSGPGIASMCGLMFGLLVIFCGVRMLFHFARLTMREKLVFVTAIVSIIFNIFVLSVLDAEGDIQYLQPIVPMGILLVVLEIKSEDFIFDMSRLAAANIVVLVLAVASLGTICAEDDDNAWPYHAYRAEPSLFVTVNALREMGYTQGIGDFWLANLITELSDGEIEMWSVQDGWKSEYYAWLQKQDHIENEPQGKFFLVLRINGNIAVEDYVMWQRNQDLQYVYSDDVYIVYGN